MKDWGQGQVPELTGIGECISLTRTLAVFPYSVSSSDCRLTMQKMDQSPFDTLLDLAYE